MEALGLSTTDSIKNARPGNFCENCKEIGHLVSFSFKQQSKSCKRGYCY